ncbi:hypothetical protein C8J56DRAFT_1170916 [Mycena floridula]|nr:hypothetical protein C8J56DRAFT_1170916 [Mycena floridula]
MYIHLDIEIGLPELLIFCGSIESRMLWPHSTGIFCYTVLDTVKSFAGVAITVAVKLRTALTSAASTWFLSNICLEYSQPSSRIVENPVDPTSATYFYTRPPISYLGMPHRIPATEAIIRHWYTIPNKASDFAVTVTDAVNSPMAQSIATWASFTSSSALGLPEIPARENQDEIGFSYDRIEPRIATPEDIGVFWCKLWNTWLAMTPDPTNEFTDGSMYGSIGFGLIIPSSINARSSNTSPDEPEKGETLHAV